MRDGDVRVDADELRGYAAAVLRAAGMDADGAAVTARVLVAADMRGVESHGVARLPQYITLIEAGAVDPTAKPVVERDRPTTALLDARNGMGQVASDAAMRLAIRKAQEHDVGVVTVRRSNHYGIAGYYAMLALEHNLIGIAMTNSSPLVAPTGGRRAQVGTNPIAAAIPSGDGRPFVLDMATSTVPVGRLEVYQRKNLPLQAGWAVDGEGVETLDAATGRAGALLPLGGGAETGGYKGYGLGVLVDLLTGGLAGALYGTLIGGLWDAAAPSDLGHFFLALDPAAFGPLEAFQSRTRDLLDRLRQGEKARGAEEIVVAGEKEERAEQDARRHGVRLYHVVATALQDVGRRHGLAGLPEAPRG